MKVKIRWAVYKGPDKKGPCFYVDSEYEARQALLQGKGSSVAPRAHYQQEDGSWRPR